MILTHLARTLPEWTTTTPTSWSQTRLGASSGQGRGRSLTGSWSLDLSLDRSLTVQYPGSRGSCWELVAVLVEVVGAGLWWRVEVAEEVVWSSERSSNNRVVYSAWLRIHNFVLQHGL